MRTMNAEFCLVGQAMVGTRLLCVDTNNADVRTKNKEQDTKESERKRRDVGDVNCTYGRDLVKQRYLLSLTMIFMSYGKKHGKKDARWNSSREVRNNTSGEVMCDEHDNMLKLGVTEVSN